MLQIQAAASPVQHGTCIYTPAGSASQAQSMTGPAAATSVIVTGITFETPLSLRLRVSKVKTLDTAQGPQGPRLHEGAVEQTTAKAPTQHKDYWDYTCMHLWRVLAKPHKQHKDGRSRACMKGLLGANTYSSPAGGDR